MNKVQPAANRADLGGHEALYHRQGEGNPVPVILLHGSGPGVSALSNWRDTLPALAEGGVYDCIAPDLYGFGESQHPQDPPRGVRQWLDLWVEQVVALTDRLGLEQPALIGNSMGGIVALHLLHRQPARFSRAVLMGSVGGKSRVTRELQRGWGFYREPSKEQMAKKIRGFVYDPSILEDSIEQIVDERWEVAMRTENKRSHEAMFPGDLQEHLDSLALSDDALRDIVHPILLLHGREDQNVPVETSFYLDERLPNSQLHVLSKCAHWVQIERADAFVCLARNFLAGCFD